MSQICNDNTKKPNPKVNKSRILNILRDLQEIQQRALRAGSTAGVAYLSMRIHRKSCRIFSLKVAANLTSGSRKGAVRA